jgi:hypothetical protein
LGEAGGKRRRHEPTSCGEPGPDQAFRRRGAFPAGAWMILPVRPGSQERASPGRFRALAHHRPFLP